MFKVVEYKRGKAGQVSAGRLTGKKTVREFPTLEAARKFLEENNQMFIQYPKRYIKEMNT